MLYENLIFQFSACYVSLNPYSNGICSMSKANKTIEWVDE